MKKKFLLPLFALLAALFMVPGHITHAENLNYSVSAQLPSNQVDSSVSYFALKVTPGQKQNLGVSIVNSDSKDHNYRVSVNRAVTNTNGVIDYSKRGVKKASSLQANIEDMTPKAFDVTVPANTTKTVTVALSVPTQAFTGVALGGIRVAQLDSTAKSSSSKGLTLTNKFAYVIGLALQEDADYSKIKPKMVLHSINAKQMNYRNYISANVENTAANLMRKLKVTAKVSKQGSSTALLSTTKSNMTMAPNSNMAFPISTNNNPLQAGKYTLDLEAWAKDDNGSYHWHFTKNFTITAAKANKLNKTAVDQKKTTNWLLWILIGLAILILLVLILLLIILLKRRKKDDDEDEASK